MDKLTEAALELLRDVASGDRRCTPAYRPAQKLVALGLCVWEKEGVLIITDAGRQALGDA